MDSLWCAHTTDSMKRLMFRQYYICLKRSIAWRLNGWRPPFSSRAKRCRQRNCRACRFSARAFSRGCIATLRSRPTFSRYLRTGLWNWGQSLKFKRLEHFPVFLSMVFVVRNQSHSLNASFQKRLDGLRYWSAITSSLLSIMLQMMGAYRYSSISPETMAFLICRYMRSQRKWTRIQQLGLALKTLWAILSG